jgi:NTP pyrophosphatase (non-canonical NTP hydrolase)
MNYIEEANRTKSQHFGQINPDVLHGAIGIATESGELLDAIKKHIYYEKQLDVVNLKEELGDLMWYMALICYVHGWTFEEIQAQNIAKLRKRYPDKFTSEASANSDLVAERKVLEGAFTEDEHTAILDLARLALADGITPDKYAIDMYLSDEWLKALPEFAGAVDVLATPEPSFVPEPPVIELPFTQPTDGSVN